MRVAWLTHHVPKVEERAGVLLPGKYAGGAERNNDYMVTAAPEYAYVDWFDTRQPWDFDEVCTYDKVVITGTEYLTDDVMDNLIPDVVWIQHHQPIRTPAKARMFQRARRFLTMSRKHMAWEAEWTGRADDFVHSPVPPNDVAPAAKEPFALFAGRAHPAKGKINARIWAADNGVDLVELENAPHDVVLEHMSRAQYFVHLPKERDACPLVVIEATLAGCEIVTNDLVGRLEPGDPREVLAAQPPKFWRIVEEAAA
jgi:hypothetical protein